MGRTPDESAPPTSPASVLRADRNLVLLLSAVFLLVLPALYGVGFGPAGAPAPSPSSAFTGSASAW